MSVFSRRKFLSAALAAAACGRTAPEDSEMPTRIFPGPGPFDPRQPQQVILPRPVIQPKNPIYTRQSPASPVHLSSSLVLRSGSSGNVSSAALKNPMGQDMELLEVKFEVSGDLSGTSAAYGGTVLCSLEMGNYKLTNTSIPVWGFGRAENLDGEVKTDTTDTKVWVAYSWRLPRPMFIPAGAAVVPNFTHAGLIPDDLNVRIGYSARTVNVKPKTFYLPWISQYVTKAFNPISAAGVDVSTELDLVNPNNEALHLQRMTGRVLYTLDGATNEVLPFSLAQSIYLRITDSYGRPLVRNFTPFRSVFGALTRSWEMDNGAMLDPQSYYLVNVRKDAVAYSSGGGAAAQAFISMVGWREMRSL